MKNINPNNDDLVITNSEMIDAISRSGYLLESQILELLYNAGFFVEANQVIIDPLTGKSREIDLVAEHYSNKNERSDITAKIKFTFEVKNNPYPMILTTNLKPSPNIEPWDAVREIVTKPEKFKNLSLENDFFEKLVGYETKGIFTQYCSFKRKKDSGNKAELMAWHPDEFHESLMKIVQHCDESAEMWAKRNISKWFRDFLFLPVLVLGGNLCELNYNKSGKPNLKKVETSRLWYNYHWKDEYKSIVIWVVTKKGLPKFISKMIEVERTLEDNIFALTKDKKSS